MKIVFLLLFTSAELSLVAQQPAQFDLLFDALKLTNAQRREIESINVPPQQEQRYGDQAAQRYERELKNGGLKIIRSGRDVLYLNSLVDRLKSQMKNAARYKSIRVNVVDSATFDARMFPGGSMFVFRGVLDSLDSEAALVGVLGHELSHLDHGHQLFELRRQKMMAELPVAAASNPQEMMVRMQTISKSFSRPHRPEDESVADADGVRWAHALGYDPRPFAFVFRDQLRGNGNNAGMFNFFASHPSSADRLKATEALCGQLAAVHPAGKALIIGTKNLKNRRAAR